MSLNLSNPKSITDYNFVASVALPATNNSNVVTSSFNLVQVASAADFYAVQVDVDALANYGTSGALSVVLQSSADNVTFANISEFAAITINANTANVTSVQYRLSQDVNPYIRGLAAITTNNGAITSNNVTVSLKF